MTVLDPRPCARAWDGETMGEIMFRGNITMKGYLKNPTATAEAFAGGWFHSGDLAVMQPDGYVKIKDRSKDVIISGGENISSQEVEDVLYGHPAVMLAAVVAQPDQKWGETPCAFVELKEGASARPRSSSSSAARAWRASRRRRACLRDAAQDFHRQDPEFLLRERAKSTTAIE
jgi:fatty-acyl-CoA synthase